MKFWTFVTTFVPWSVKILGLWMKEEQPS